MSTPATVFTPPIDRPPPAPPVSPYGGFWIRLAAHFVDGFIIGIIAFVLALILFLAAGLASVEWVSNAISLGLIAVGQIYHAYFVSSAKMATPGKRLCGLYVTDLEGRRLSFGRALWRNVAALFSYLTLYIGFIMAGFTERKQALHDKIAGTLVHRQPGSSAAVLVVAIIIGVFIVVAIIGILAAIAIPAYQDYTVRAKMNGLYYSLRANRTPIQDYAEKNGAWPTTWAQVQSAGGSNPMEQLAGDTRRYVEDVRLEQNGAMIAALKINGKAGELRLAPGKTGTQVEWACSSSPEIRRFVPPDCRN